jgi:hypothetical protein
MAHKLLVETMDSSNVEYVVEEKNLKGSSEPRMWIVGEYMMAGSKNKNGRVYDLHEMAREVNNYTKDFIKGKRSMGELNHPTSAEVDLERACHLVTELYMDRNIAMGKSMVLSTPTGKILESLIKDGVQVGVSSRALGKLVPMEGSADANRVQDMKLIAIDCVADPSYPKAFVNGILESKQYVVEDDGSFEEIYNQFESSLINLPRKDVEEYLKEQITTFIRQIQQRQ